MQISDRYKKYKNLYIHLIESITSLKIDFDELIPIISMLMCEVGYADRSGIILFNKDKTQGYIKSGFNIFNSELTNTGQIIIQLENYPEITEVIRSRRMLHLDNQEQILQYLPADEFFHQETGQLFKINAVLICPIFLDNTLIGVIRIDKFSGVFTEDDESFCNILCDYITSRMEVQRNIWESEEWFKVIFDHSPIGISIVGTDGFIKRVNDKFCLFVNYPENELVRLSIYQVVLPDDEEKLFDIFDSVIEADVVAGARDVFTEIRFCRKDGSVFWGRIGLSPKVDFEHNPDCLIVTIEDITDQKKIENELVTAREIAEAANRTKSSFLSNMSHEFRTPLNSIIGYTSLLEDDLKNMLSGEQKRILDFKPKTDSILSSGKKMLKLIEDILSLSEMRNGEDSIFSEPVDLESLIDELHLEMLPLADEKNIIMHFDVDPGLKQIHADEARIKQAMLHLLQNAVKFSDDHKEIGLEIKGTGKEAIITVWDQGRGIPQEQLETIFKPFEQIRFNTKYEEGAGIGLTLTKKIIELHSGSISVTSKVGEGSRFTITLPL